MNAKRGDIQSEVLLVEYMMFADDAVLVDVNADVLYGKFKRRREKWIENKLG